MDQNRLQAMHALMNRMGMMAAEGGFGGGGAQTGAILTKIKSANEVEQLDGLNEFINLLNMATEATIMSISPQQFVGPIMACFQKQHNPELMLVAARSLTYLVDANTHTVRCLQRDDHLNVLLDSLREIMDVEFAEQVLTCVDKIATDDPASILQKDGVSAIMGFLDFFSMTTQRLILHTVARIAESFRPQHYSKIESSLPTIRNSLRHDDNRMREEALSALTRFIKNASSSPSCVTNIFGDAGPAVMEILEKRPTNAMFGTAIQLISTATTSSAVVCESMIEIGAVSFLASLLDNTTASNVGQGSFAAPGDSTPMRPSSLPSDSNGSPLSPSGSAAGSGVVVAPTPTQQPRLAHDRVVDVCKCLLAFAPEVIDESHYISYIDSAEEAGKKSTGRSDRSAMSPSRQAKVLLKALTRGMEEDDDNVHDHDEGDDSDDDDDDYEDFDPHEASPAEQKEMLEALINEEKLKIENKVERNSQCNKGRHTCDVCQAPITDPELWLRCNTRNDYDICAACMLEMDGDEEHTYTCMKSVFPAPSPTVKRATASTPTRLAPATTDSEKDQRSLRVEMIKKAPYLVNRLAEALPVMCRLHLHNDDVAIRSKCLSFICRVVHHASKECLRQALLDCPLCEMVTQLLTTTKLNELGQCIHICEQLMTKLPDIYTDLFIREGVTNGLAVVKSMVSMDKRSEAAAKPISEVVATVEGWKAILAYEANEIVNKFEDSVDSGRIATMETLCKRLRDEADPTEAIKQAATVLSDISTFELMNSDLVGSILARFSSTEDPEILVARFVAQLAEQHVEMDQQYSTLLDRFVHQLQSAVSQVEKFASPQNDKSNANDPIRLTLRPHDPAASSTAAKAKPKKADKKKSSSDNAKKTRGKKGDDNDNANPPEPTMKKTEGKTATVSIDPLASVMGIIDFIRTNLLPTSKPKPQAPDGSSPARAQQAGADEEDAVEDIDPTPEDGNDDGAATKKARKEVPVAEPPLYLRYRTHALPNSWTMLQVMQQIVNKNKKEQTSSRGSDSIFGGEDVPWHLRQLMALGNAPIVEIHYSTEPFTVPTVSRPLPTGNANPSSPDAANSRPVRFNPNLLLTSGAVAVRSAISRTCSGSSAFVSPILANILKLLMTLHAACNEWQSLMTWLAMQTGSYDLPKSLTEPRISHTQFVNQKINSKAMQHSSNVAMAGQHDQAWYIRVLQDYPILFTPATRKFLFEITYFGVSRSLVRLQEHNQENGTLVDSEKSLERRRQNRIIRRKCRVVREKPIECAMQVLSSNKATLGSVFEFEFKGEPGSGLGPTMEFYSLVGQALSQKSLGLWRRSEEDTETHFAALTGLYPAPFVPSGQNPRDRDSEQYIVKYYTFLGRFLARVLLDRRIPNLRLSRPLLKMLRGDELAFDDIGSINPKIYEVLLAMAVSDHSAQKGYLATLPRPCSVDDLGLTFVLPGVEEIPLVPNGADIEVTTENMSSYTQEVSTALLCSSVNVAIKSLREGFSSVINLQALKALTVDELSALLKGHEERITLAELEANVACDHGYSLSHPTIRLFLEILSEMSQQEQQKFFQFLTGSPMLPVGGLAALKPKFTIVRKTSSDSRIAEQAQLPSAMTCQNFLKLPAYDSKEAMLKKLKLAIDEGANAFLFT